MNAENKPAPTSESLIEKSVEFEQRLQSAGYSQAHDWVFAFREMLYDLGRVNREIEALFTIEDLTKALPAMRNLIADMKYGVLKHIESHMTEVETELDKVLPPD